MPQLMQYCDVVMGNVWASEKMLGIPVTPDIHEQGQRSIYLTEAQSCSAAIMKRFPRCKAVANTFRFGDGGYIEYYAAMYTNGTLYHSSAYTSGSIVDKVGSGDCFMAGLVYGFYNRLKPAEILEFATAAAFDKLFIPSDATTSTVEHIKNGMSCEY
jgi:2-dehydro-3-deoxygluconokinase